MAGPIQRPQEDELKHLSKEARIQRLREFEEAQRKRLEELEKEIEEDLEEVEEIIQQEEEEDEAERRSSQDDEEEDDLEAKVATEEIEVSTPEEERPYRLGPREPTYERTDIYQTLEDATSTIQELPANREWTTDEQLNYRRAREQIDRAQQWRSEYGLDSERIREEFDMASSVLDRLQYNRL